MSAPSTAHSVVDLLVDGARRAPDELVYIFVSDSHDEVRLTRAQLLARVQTIAAGLLRHAAPGERVTIELPQGEGYVSVFWACLYAGLVPVPLYPSANADVRRRLAGIAADSGARIAVVADGDADSSAQRIDLAALLAGPAPAPAAAPPVAPAPIEPASLAYLQYSSGSTGAPKGVMISHANIMANLAMIARAANVGSADVFVNWLPLHHDLGLVNTVLLPMASGSLSVIGTPLSFMRNPLSWLTRIAHYGGTISGGPNFAYQAVLDRLRSRGQRGASTLAELDLSRWRVAFNAAEPIQTSTLEAFTEALAPAGFSSGVFFAAYGMAEATVFVCGAAWDRAREAGTIANQAGATDLAPTIACGPADPRHLIVVGADGEPAPPGTQGEIWIRGAHVSSGYFGGASEAQQAFARHTAAGEGPFFATGDSGVVEHGQLYVLGRIKDMIIQNGRNIYPTDVEQVVRSVLADDKTYAGCAAIGKRQGGTEAVVLVLEARNRAAGEDADDHAELLARISARVFEEQGVLLEAIVVVRQGAIQKTSSGKVRRQALRDALEAGQLQPHAVQAQSGQRYQASADPQLESALAALLTELTGQPVDQPERSFFAYGVSSLQIHQLVAELGERFDVALSVQDVFEHPTLRRLSNRIAAIGDAASANGNAAMPAVLAEGALSANQQMMLSIDAWSSAKAAYHLPLVLALGSDVDPMRLAQVAEQTLMRHAILRTVYAFQPDGRHQARVLPASGFRVAVQAADGAARAALLAELARRPFDLASDYPVRGMVLVDAGAAETMLALVFHHIAADGWSLRLLAGQILERYAAADPAPEAQVAFEMHSPAAGVTHTALAYWNNQLAGLPEVHSLPLDGARASARARNPLSARHGIVVDGARVEALRRLCGAQDATLFSGVHAVLALALARFGNHPDVVLGTFLSGRDTAQLRERIGFYAHTTLLRTTLDLNAGMAQLIRLCRDTLQGAHRHSQVSYLDLLRELKPARDPSYNPLFQVSLNYHDYGGQGGAISNGAGLAAHLVALGTGVARYDLSVDVYPADGRLSIEFEYDTTLFEHGSIARLGAFVDTLLASALAAPQTPVGRLSGHQAPPLAQAGDAPVSLYQRFRAVADAAPDAVAVRYQQQSLSYRELSAEADRLAALIDTGAAGALAGQRIMIFMRRTPAYVAAILAILKLDCTYVPLDPDYVQDALAHRIGFIAPACVLVDETTRPAVAAVAAGVAVIDTAAAPVQTSASADAARPHGRHPAYILFTSGSTGSPKAVSMGHRALHNLIDAISVDLHHAAPKVLNYSSIGFDMHFTEVFTALFNGGAVVLADAAMRRNTVALLGLLAAEGVSVLNLSYPVLCELALGAEQAEVRLPAVRVVLSTAQQLKITPGLRCFFERHPAARLFNHYGPTETHVVTVAALGHTPSAWPDVPDIGQPIGHCTCFVVNASGVPEAPGAIGELYVAGVPLAEGYYANAAMTAQRFVHVADGAGRQVRAYRTGDFVRIRNDGALQYFGRKDQEIKVRGLRVDLSDIEASIQRGPGVAQTVVVARPAGTGLRIVAYVQPLPGAPCSEEEIDTRLRQSLPAYMVPDRVVLVEGFVLNQNAKIDLSKLPEPAARGPAQFDTPGGKDAQAAPWSDHEQVVYDIWRKVLGHDGFGRATSFFEAGGDSLALMAVKRELDVRYVRDIDLVEIYGSPSVAALAALVGGNGQAEPSAAFKPRRNLNTARRQRLAAARAPEPGAAR